MSLNLIFLQNLAKAFFDMCSKPILGVLWLAFSQYDWADTLIFTIHLAL